MPVAALAAGAIALLPALASAEEIHTSQAVRANAGDTTWAPLGDRPAAVCLIDTGVNEQPDTASTVVQRLAVDGGSGDDIGGTLHGTLVAMMISAPLNGWGMVGIAPGIPIVSVRASDGAGSFFSDDVRGAMTTCRQIAPDYNIRDINLSLGTSAQPSPATLTAFGDAVDAARARGISVTASAGNVPGPLEFPANVPGVLSVAAGDSDGPLCSFAAGDPTQDPPADIVAPGCALDVAMPDSGIAAWVDGSSEAVGEVAGALAQLYTARPDLTPDEAEHLLTDNATPTAGGPTLDVAAAWRAAGLEQLLAAGAAARPPEPQPAPDSHADGQQPTPREPQQQPPNQQQPEQPAPLAAPSAIAPPRAHTIARRWAAPRVRRLAYDKGVLTLTAARPPRGAVLVARFSGRPRRGREFDRWQKTARSRTGRLRLRVQPWTLATIQLRGAGRSPSAMANIRPRVACSRGCQR